MRLNQLSQAYAGVNRSSILIGNSRTRTPVAWWTAAVIAGATPGQADLADPTRTKFVNLFVWIIEEVHVDRRRVGVHCHDVVSQITVDRRAALLIVGCVLKKRHTDSHHHPA